MTSLNVADFDFALPDELIAQSPPEVRGSSRMLCVDRATGRYEDDLFASLPHRLREGDLLILNDSRVIPARLYATRKGRRAQSTSTGPTGRIEVLLTQQTGPDTWTALVRPGRKVQLGETLLFADEGGTVALPEVLLTAVVEAAADYGERTLRFEPNAEFFSVLDRIGHMPLPPYIHRADSPGDRDRYQTIMADQRGSAAAPTAGLHFTAEMLDRLRAKGIQIEMVTLHVGLGTFQPVRVERVADIRLHAEHYTLSARTAMVINEALAAGRRVIAVGTTTTRMLEHCAQAFPNGLKAHSGETSIFLSPGHVFRVVGGLLTNFHLPQSTLLMLVSAFAGRESVRAAYAHAVEQQYRFFSYGDCMLLL